MCGEILKIIKTKNRDLRNIEHDVKYYRGRKKSVIFYKNTARILINTIGLDNAKHIGDKMLIIGFIGLFISFLFLVILNSLTSSSLSYPYNFYILAFFISIVLIGYYVFISSTNYYKSTICERCNWDFVYKEDCKPDIREIKKKNGTVIKFTTRSYKCSHCGNKKFVSDKKVIEPIYYSDMV